jgi:hypothetical protein
MLFVIQFSCFQQVLHRGKLIFNETTFASKPNSNKFRKETRLQNNTIFPGLKFSFKIASSINFYFEKSFYFDAVFKQNTSVCSKKFVFSHRKKKSEKKREKEERRKAKKMKIK